MKFRRGMKEILLVHHRPKIHRLLQIWISSTFMAQAEAEADAAADAAGVAASSSTSVSENKSNWDELNKHAHNKKPRGWDKKVGVTNKYKINKKIV